MKRIVSVWLPSFATDRLHGPRRTPTGAPPSEAGPPSGTVGRRWRPPPPARAGCASSPSTRRRAPSGCGRGCRWPTPARCRRPSWSSRPIRPPSAGRSRPSPTGVAGTRRGRRSTGMRATRENSAAAPGCGSIRAAAHICSAARRRCCATCSRALKALGFTATAAIAETAGAAWAIARFGGERIAVLPAGTAAVALAPLPVRGLRLPPEIATALRRMGLRRIGDLLPLPRAPLAARFGDLLLRRLDQALGRLDEPLCSSPAAAGVPRPPRLRRADRPDGGHSSGAAASTE